METNKTPNGVHYNLAETAVLALIGLAFIPEVFMETEWQYKIDDMLAFLIGIGIIVWYERTGLYLKKSVFPIIAVILMLFIKIGAIFVEMKDAADVGDDMGTIFLLIAATGFIVWQYLHKNRLQAANK